MLHHKPLRGAGVWPHPTLTVLVIYLGSLGKPPPDPSGSDTSMGSANPPANRSNAQFVLLNSIAVLRGASIARAAPRRKATAPDTVMELVGAGAEVTLSAPDWK